MENPDDRGNGGKYEKKKDCSDRIGAWFDIKCIFRLWEGYGGWFFGIGEIRE